MMRSLTVFGEFTRKGEKIVLVWLRWLLYVGLSYLLLFHTGRLDISLQSTLFIAAALTSNLVLMFLPERFFPAKWFGRILLAGDSVFVFIALVLAGFTSGYFIVFYFLIMLMATFGKGSDSVLWNGLIFVALYSLLLFKSSPTGIALRSELLLQIPFLLICSIFYGLLVHREHQKHLDALYRISKEQEKALLAAETTRQDLEEQLRTAQKMEAVGRLAGGVAHDFNNLLSVILIYADFAYKRAPEGDPIKDDLLEVKKAGNRAAALTRQLLAFGRKQVLQPVPLSLNDVAARVETMLRRIIGEDIDFVQVLAPDLGVVRADPGQIEQVLMNLVVNARDAMPEGGKLTIETANVEIDEEYAARHVGVKPGLYVRLAVTDTGCGMDERIKSRLFEPFFTTKEKGKGTGLGLSTAYGIVKQSGGDIWVYSEPGRGTTFKIYLPRDPMAVPISSKPPKVARRTAGTETILVVEDEEALRKVARRALEEAGYTVLTAADGEEALQTAARHAGDIHLLLTDVVMPRIGGKALAQELAKARPALKVLYMSGYTDIAIVHHGVLDAGTHFIGKPFTAASLTSKVREVLDEDVAEVAEESEPTVKAVVEAKEQPFDKAELQALPREVLERLGSAAIAARYDEILEIIETIGITRPKAAARLRRMADRFDYDGIRELLGG